MDPSVAAARRQLLDQKKYEAQLAQEHYIDELETENKTLGEQVTKILPAKIDAVLDQCRKFVADERGPQWEDSFRDRLKNELVEVFSKLVEAEVSRRGDSFAREELPGLVGKELERMCQAHVSSSSGAAALAVGAGGGEAEGPEARCSGKSDAGGPRIHGERAAATAPPSTASSPSDAAGASDCRNASDDPLRRLVSVAVQQKTTSLEQAVQSLAATQEQQFASVRSELAATRQAVEARALLLMEEKLTALGLCDLRQDFERICGTVGTSPASSAAVSGTAGTSTTSGCIVGAMGTNRTTVMDLASMAASLGSLEEECACLKAQALEWSETQTELQQRLCQSELEWRQFAKGLWSHLRGLVGRGGGSSCGEPLGAAGAEGEGSCEMRKRACGNVGRSVGFGCEAFLKGVSIPRSAFSSSEWAAAARGTVPHPRKSALADPAPAEDVTLGADGCRPGFATKTTEGDVSHSPSSASAESGASAGRLSPEADHVAPDSAAVPAAPGAAAATLIGSTVCSPYEPLLDERCSSPAIGSPTMVGTHQQGKPQRAQELMSPALNLPAVARGGSGWEESGRGELIPRSVAREGLSFARSVRADEEERDTGRDNSREDPAIADGGHRLRTNDGNGSSTSDGLIARISQEVFQQNFRRVKETFLDHHYVSATSSFVLSEFPHLRQMFSKLQTDLQQLSHSQNDFCSGLSHTQNCARRAEQVAVTTQTTLEGLALRLAEDFAKGLEKERGEYERRLSTQSGKLEKLIEEKISAFGRLNRGSFLSMQESSARLMDEVSKLKLQVAGPETFRWSFSVSLVRELLNCREMGRAFHSEHFRLKSRCGLQLVLFPRGKLLSSGMPGFVSVALVAALGTDEERCSGGGVTGTGRGPADDATAPAGTKNTRNPFELQDPLGSTSDRLNNKFGGAGGQGAGSGPAGSNRGQSLTVRFVFEQVRSPPVRFEQGMALMESFVPYDHFADRLRSAEDAGTGTKTKHFLDVLCEPSAQF